ncbi:MAG: SprT family zinc-dependent metalloprotease [Bacteroidales bacterium]
MYKREKLANYAGIGTVRYVRNPRARNLAIRINARGDVRVTVPGRVSQQTAEAFFGSKRDWVIRVLKRQKNKGMQGSLPSPGDWIRVGDRQVRVLLQNGEDSVEEAIWRVLLEEGRTVLTARVRELAARHGFAVRDVKIRRMTTRWGSCNRKNGINLNSWLVMVPPHLRDYVILHELVHIHHPNHGPGFWAELDGLCGGQSKTYRRELHACRIMQF